MLWCTCITGGEDYSGVSQTLTFEPGIDELCTSFISILGDDEIEPTEIILISLTPVNTDIGNGPNVIANILDDDGTFKFTDYIVWPPSFNVDVLQVIEVLKIFIPKPIAYTTWDLYIMYFF